MANEKLPINLHKIYSFVFLVPLLIIFLVLVFFDFLTPVNIFIVGFVYVVGELFFISKAKLGKREWLYSDIAFILYIVVMLTLIYKIN